MVQVPMMASFLIAAVFIMLETTSLRLWASLQRKPRKAEERNFRVTLLNLLF